MRRFDRSGLLMLVVGAAGLLIGADVEVSRAEEGPAPPGFSVADPVLDREALDARAVARIEEPSPGLPAVPVPAHNRPSAAKIRLGRKLFLDRRLSGNGTLSCAMCHVPEQGFTSNELATAVGHEGKSLRRNSPTLLDVAYAGPFFHDGREPDLDLQALDVMVNPDEMAMPSLGAVVARVRSLPDYEELFEEAFGAPATVESIGRALGTYLRSLVTGDSPFDRWHFGGDEDAVSDAVQRGFALFTGKAGCAECHFVGEDNALFTDHGFHDTGIGWLTVMVRGRSREPVRVELAPGVYTDLDRAAVESVGEPPAHDLGRYEITWDPGDRWKFKTPTLRNVARTAPYMHDGSLTSLREVVEHYDRGGVPHEGQDPRLRPLGLTEREKDDLVAFLESLTGSHLDALVRDARVGPQTSLRPETTASNRSPSNRRTTGRSRRTVSSRRGPVDTNPTGAPTSSSTRRR
jgi:cytochrome c peroxidase